MNARSLIVRPHSVALALLLTINAGTAIADATLNDVSVVADLTNVLTWANPGVAVADLNNDSFDDLIVLAGPDHTFIALGAAMAPFAQRISFPNGPFASDHARYNSAFIDLDRDSNLDAIIRGAGYLNDGNGNFGPSITLPFTNNGVVKVADMNADSFLDVVAGQNQVEIYLSTGPLTFSDPFTVPSFEHLHDVGTVSSDAVPDILDEFRIMISTTQAGVGDVYEVGEGNGILADLDGDSLAEVIKVQWISSVTYPQLRVLKFNGAGFDQTQWVKLPLGFVVSTFPPDFEIVPLDHDNDGDTDLAVAQARSKDEFGFGMSGDWPVPSEVLILKNDGNGVLSVSHSIPSGGLMPIAVAAGDFDAQPGDDLVTANNGLTISRPPSFIPRLYGRFVTLNHTDNALGDTPQQLAQGPISSGEVSGVIFADVNEDAIADMVAVTGGDLEIRLASAPGVFDNTQVFAYPNEDFFDPIVADANGDDVPDALVRRMSPNAVHTYIRIQPYPIIQPGWSFVTGVRAELLGPSTSNFFPVQGRSFHLDDTNTDRVTFANNSVNSNTARLNVSLIDGKAFQTTTTTIPGQIRRIEPIDANNDGATDILLYKSADPRDPACTCWHDWRVEVYFNDGSGHFSAENFITIEQLADEISGLIVADFSGDSRSDIVVTTLASQVRLYTQTSTGFTDPAIRDIAPLSMTQPAVADFDLDGELDIASAVLYRLAPLDILGFDAQSLFLFSSREYGFNRQSRLAHHGGVPGIAIAADFNSDGRADYIMGNTVGGVSTYPNASIPPPKCVADANADGLVDGRDLSVLLAQFGEAVAPGTGADLNDDGVVNGLDLSVLLSQFGTSCQ